MTKAQQFIAKAKDLMPKQDKLQDLDSSIDSWSHIDEVMFNHGEYIGGMADVIITLCQRESA